MSTIRNIEEIKADIRKRIGHRTPFSLADHKESEEALAKLKSIDPEPWAEAWSNLGARWEKSAIREEKAGHSESAKNAFFKATSYYGIARHPFPNSPGKTRENYLAAARYFDPPLEYVTIPFDGKEIVGYLRLPSKGPIPLILHWGGIDNWKEERHFFAESFLKEGWGCFVLDSPGTGESPILASVHAHKLYCTVLDALSKRKEVYKAIYKYFRK